MPSPASQVKQYRVAKGMTVRGLSYLLGCSPTTIIHLESGKRLPGRDLALTIRRKIGIAPEAWSHTYDTPIPRLGTKRKPTAERARVDSGVDRILLNQTIGIGEVINRSKQTKRRK